jgi:hypothetical protein
MTLFSGSVGDYKGFGGIFCLHLHFNHEDGGSNFLRIIGNHVQGYTMAYSEDPNLKYHCREISNITLHALNLYCCSVL